MVVDLERGLIEPFDFYLGAHTEAFLNNIEEEEHRNTLELLLFVLQGRGIDVPAMEILPDGGSL